VDGEEETVAGLRRRRLGEGESERRRGSGSVGVDGAGVCAATEPDCLRACCTAAVLVRCGGEGRGGAEGAIGVCACRQLVRGCAARRGGIDSIQALGSRLGFGGEGGGGGRVGRGPVVA